MTGGGQAGAYTGCAQTGTGQPMETWNDTPAWAGMA
jgi:hypothetical protein